MSRAILQGDFWGQRLEVNARQAIFHQWQQLEASGCIENFRLTAGLAEGFREGWFFADSDAYKWLEAASRAWATSPDPRLGSLMDGFIELLGRAQMPDGYLFTYNQLHFPGVRWHNLQVEHELYCHGHLIEAGVSHYEVTGRTNLLEIARRAADRVVADFRGKGPAFTPGHEEIEIALLRLHDVTPGDTAYLNQARQFIERRGLAHGFGLSVVQQQIDSLQRGRNVRQKKQDYLASHPDFKPFQLPPDNLAVLSPKYILRWIAIALSGEYFQQHAPVRQQVVPVGHSVRFGYLKAATARLGRAAGDRSLLPALEQTWERMVTRRMFVTGGIGSLPGLEGFGHDYELDPETAYNETCAALASLLWNWEMAMWTGEAKYSELFEWQLYNAASIGMGLDGTTYFYHNPLACRGNLSRQPWYSVPCCPSNLSRTWGNLGHCIFSTAPGKLTLHQYISCRLEAESLPMAGGGTAAVGLEMQSGLPWEGRVRLEVKEAAPSAPGQPAAFELLLRQPTWAGEMEVRVNGSPAASAAGQPEAKNATASGYDPRPAVFLPIHRLWSSGDVVEIDFSMPIQLRRAHPKVRGHQGKAAVTRGPLVYCLESTDNPGVDLFDACLDPNLLAPVFDSSLLGGTIMLQGFTRDGKPLTFIPYFLWGNRGLSQMNVWVKI